MGGESHLVTYKRLGETPLQALGRVRRERPDLESVPLTYAGRLDPMAEGLLLVLIGDECRRKDEYLRLDKEYETEALFGISTDSGDVLGVPERGGETCFADAEIEHAVSLLVGTHHLPYPAFSSRTVSGKPLFAHALAGTLDLAERPKREMRVLSAEVLGTRAMSHLELLEHVLSRIALLSPPVPGRPETAFRRDEITAAWRALRACGPYRVARLRLSVSSGSYIRSLVPLLGELLRSHALALSIRRTRIGAIVGR